MCRVSVIVPCYDIETKIGGCLNALVSQTYKNFEVVFIDDCSADNSYKVIEDFKKSSNIDVKLIRLDKNSGPGIARNVGIQNSSGELLCFCDADDCYSNEFLEKMVQAIDCGNDIAMCKIALYKNGEKFASYTNAKEIKNINDLIVYNDGSLCNIIFKKSLFSDVNLPSIYHGEDMAIVPVLISKANKFQYIDEELYRYSVQQNSLSRRVSEKSCNELLASFEFLKNNIDEKYKNEVEFCGVKIVLYGYTLNAIKARLSNKIIKQAIKNFKLIYPKWYKNKYIKELGFAKRLYLMSIRCNLLFCNRLYSKMHEILLKRG